LIAEAGTAILTCFAEGGGYPTRDAETRQGQSGAQKSPVEAVACRAAVLEIAGFRQSLS
jgi:hypothetical protein